MTHPPTPPPSVPSLSPTLTRPRRHRRLDDIFDEIDSSEGEGRGNDDGGVSPTELGAWWKEVTACKRHRSCGACRLAHCAWCLAAGRCVKDESGTTPQTHTCPPRPLPLTGTSDGRWLRGA